MSYDWLGLLMFVGALVFLSSGYPVAFSLGGVALIFALIGSLLGVFDPIFLTAMPSRIFGIMSNYTLLAIPYFIFLGSMLETTGIAEKLLETMGILFGRMRGGISFSGGGGGGFISGYNGGGCGYGGSYGLDFFTDYVTLWLQQAISNRSDCG